MKLSTLRWLAMPLSVWFLLADPNVMSSAVREDGPPPPTPEEIRLIEELATWVHGEDSYATGFGTSLGSPRPEILGRTVTDRRRSFDLFRSFNEAQAHNRVLAELPYGGLVERTALELQVDGLLVAAVIEAESGFNPRVVSSVGALGLMQLMPATASQYGVLDPMSPEENVRAGSRYLRDLLAEFDGELVLALAAYNAGPGNVRRYSGVPPFLETQRYVERVLGTYIGYHRSLWLGTDFADLLGVVDGPETRV